MGFLQTFQNVVVLIGGNAAWPKPQPQGRNVDEIVILLFLIK